jgi:hypothetical protein
LSEPRLSYISGAPFPTVPPAVVRAPSRKVKAAFVARVERPKFTIEVDSENKAKSLNVFSFDFPHHASFHVSWIGFFVSFVSTFAAAPMVGTPPTTVSPETQSLNSEP